MAVKRKAVVKAGERNEDGKLLSVSGWCTTGQHKPDEKTMGCREVFSGSICICDCHGEVDSEKES